jgi:hypothetical protein
MAVSKAAQKRMEVLVLVGSGRELVKRNSMGA